MTKEQCEECEYENDCDMKNVDIDLDCTDFEERKNGNKK